MTTLSQHNIWPDLPYTAWKETCATLQLWTQVVGKVRLALAPWHNHSWQVPLYVSARGLTTSPIHYRHSAFELDFDFIAHSLVLSTSDGARVHLSLEPRTVADFYAAVMSMLQEQGISVQINELPTEIPNAIPF